MSAGHSPAIVIEWLVEFNHHIEGLDICIHWLSQVRFDFRSSDLGTN
jgi:hypothetical protein